MNSAVFVQEAFQEYYSSGYPRNQKLAGINEREFGFASFEGWMLRHKNFKDEEGLTSFLRDSVPRDAYVSCAYYEDPTAEMEKKGWKGADLVFDIDADHIPTSCDKVHDEWKCSKCGFSGKGTTPEKCPACEGEKFDETTWPCEVCLASAKTEAVKLLDMLLDDFGFAENELHVFFSGHRGYHIHVEGERAKELDAMARKEIVDYVSGIGLTLPPSRADGKDQSIYQAGKDLFSGGFGWRRRLASGIKDSAFNADAQKLVDMGIGKREIAALLANKKSLSKNRPDAETVYKVKGVGLETWRRIAEHVVETQSAKIDTVVTTDIHRLIRLSETLHSKTGLRKVEFSPSAIGNFDPFKHAIAFKGGFVTLLVSHAPKFRMGEETFGPYKDQRVELPTSAAMLLLCRSRAEVVE